MPEAHHRTHLAAVWVALFVTVLWSSSWVLIRWGLDGERLEPITFAALRYGMAAAIVVGWMLFRGRPQGRMLGVGRSMVWQLVLLGVLMYTVTQGSMFVALNSQPAATTSLMLALTPLFVVGTAALSLAEFPSGLQIVGAVLVAVGAWLYFIGDLGATTVGMVAAVVALTANVASGLLGRHVNRQAHLSPVVVTAISMAVGAGILVIVGFAVEGMPSVSLRAWLIIGWLAVVNTALAFTLWNLSLRRLSAIESAGINTTMLIQIAVLAWVFLDETPGIAALGGVLLVSTGVFLTQINRARTRSGLERSPSRHREGA